MLLLGAPLVIWRTARGEVCVWEDRCPHRSVRLSAGRNLGDVLECCYHGWRFSPDGAVAAVPAETCAPDRDIRVRALASAVAGGMVWASPGQELRRPVGFKPGKTDALLHPIAIHAPAEKVKTFLEDRPGIWLHVTPTSAASCMVFGHGVREGRESELETARRCGAWLKRIRRAIETGRPE
jgi:nitrite reductase/ring-hydroxylating ferredoxin subunit